MADVPSWRNLVRRELERYRRRTGSEHVDRQNLLRQSKHRFAQAYPDAETPEQTVNRCLQELRDTGELTFLDKGQYRIEQLDLSDVTLTVITEREREVLELWGDIIADHPSALQVDLLEHYDPEEARQRARTFIDEPSWEHFKEFWSLLSIAQHAGSPSKIYNKWTEQRDRTDAELASLIKRILTEEEFDPAWEEELGAKRTLWELFGLLHIETHPIINNPTVRTLKLLGYPTIYSYKSGRFFFEDFKLDYLDAIGHGSAGTPQEVPVNLEINHFLSIIDKVSDDNVGTESFEEVPDLHRLFLRAKDNENVDETTDKEQDTTEEVIIDPDDQRPPKTWQVAPDANLALWDAWSDHGIMAIGWAELGDLSDLDQQAIAERLGLDPSYNDVQTLDYFANSIIPGDVVICRHGRNALDGIGVVTSEYYHDPDRAAKLFPDEYTDYQQLIDVDWIIDFVDDYNGPINRPESLKQFAMQTICRYRYYEDLQAALVEQYPDLRDQFKHLEQRQSELSNAYWGQIERDKEYEGITDATTDILNRLERDNERNLLSAKILVPIIDEWTDVLRRNDLVGGEIATQDVSTYERILELYRDNETALDEQAAAIGAGYVGSLTKGQTLFVVLLRDLQQQAGVSRPNFNHVKMELLLKGNHRSEMNTLSGDQEAPDNAATIERQLTRTGQLVFHGPPGTGKTYTAQRFARWWITEESETPTEDQLEVVTFHPSFAYEDFIEGLSAEAQDGAVSYDVKAGVFKRLCKRAQRAYEQHDGDDVPPYVLIIDEINRGNLAQIFGETITLLESDKRLTGDNETRTTLPHSGERFGVPPNLYVIGTMNTADRSIALVDMALRRRFRFIECPPDMTVVYDAYGFAGAQEVEETAVDGPDPVRQLLALSILGVEQLNEAILEAPDLGKGKQIGHSYLLGMADGASVEEQLQSIVDAWQYEILPLLSEYYFGQFDRIQQDLFAGGGGKVFEWSTEQIREFDPAELAQTLIEITGVPTTWQGPEDGEEGTVYTINLLLDEGILEQGDELLFDEQRVPGDATKAFDAASPFWRCEVTGETGQQNTVRWLHNDELYSLSGLAGTIMSEIADYQGKTGTHYWRHPEYDDQTLGELRNSLLEQQGPVRESSGVAE